MIEEAIWASLENFSHRLIYYVSQNIITENVLHPKSEEL